MRDCIVFNSFDGFPTPVFLLNKQNRIIYVNEKFKREFGETVDGNLINSMHKSRKKLLKKSSESIISKNGHLFNLDIMPLKANNDQTILMGILRDITELRKLKEYVHYLEKQNKGINIAFKRQLSLVEKLSREALTDGLTGLYNHRHFWEQANVELKRANRYSESLSCILIDIDNFKSINDRFNHQFGDSVLKKIANILETPLRATDILARYGGDEFAILLSNTDYQGSRIISDKILKRIRNAMFEIKDFFIKITISIGVSSYPTDQVSGSSQLVEYADAALYDAKAKGKNRVSFFHCLQRI